MKSLEVNKFHSSLHFFLLSLLAFGFSFNRRGEYDMWWHLSLGRDIFEKGLVNPADTMSYTFFGAPQYSGEWLGDLVLFLSVKLFGMQGANLLLFVVLSLTLAFLYKALQAEAPENKKRWHYTCILALVLILFAIRFRLSIRPFIFTYLFIAVYLFVLAHYRAKKQSAILWFLLFLELIWANMSKGAFYGPFLVGLFTLDQFFRDRRDWRPAICLIGTAAISLINPEGLNLYTNLLKFSLQGNESLAIGEHRPLSAQLLWGYGLYYTFGYQLLVLLSAIYFLFFRGWKNYFHVFLAISFFLPTLWMIRMIDFFSLAAVLFVAPALYRLTVPLQTHFRCREKQFAVAFAGTLIIAFFVSVPWNRTYAFGSGVKEDTFPRGALSFVEAKKIEGRLFNSYPFGGYLTWFAPERKVFIDGRVNQLYPPEFHELYSKILESPEYWAEEERKWGFDCAILEYDFKSNGSHFPLHLTNNPDWALVYWDNISTVYLKRTPRNASIIAAHEYSVARPNFNNFDYIAEKLKKEKPNILLARLEREISANPLNQEPRLLKTFLLYKNNFRGFLNKQIIEELEKCLELKPDLAFEHSALAMLLLETKRKPEAHQEALKALALNPSDAAARNVMNKLGFKIEPIASPSPH